MSIRTETRGDVALITLDRPPVNALDLPTLEGLIDAIAQVRAGALVLAGRPGSFSAGVDLKAMLRYGPEEHRAMMAGVNRICHALFTAPCPTVAAVTGHALGGGLILLATCDLRVGARGPGVYALPEVRAGVPFPGGALAVLRHAIAPTAARRLGLGDARADAEEALRLGLVDELVEPDLVVERAVAEAQRLSALPGRVHRRTRLAMGAELLRELEGALDEHLRGASDWVGGDTERAARGVLDGRGR